MENRLRAATAGVLAALKAGGVVVAMATGDHPLTGASVARYMYVCMCIYIAYVCIYVYMLIICICI